MKNTVKILAFADVHGRPDLVTIGDAEVVIVAGDIGANAPKHTRKKDFAKIGLEWAESRSVLDWFKGHDDVRFYVLPGNHDYFLDSERGGDPRKVRKLWPRNVHILRDGKYYVDPSGFTICGMPWNPHKKMTEGGGAFCTSPEHIAEACQKITRHLPSLDILVVHAPPRLPEGPYDSDDWHMNPVLGEMLPKLNPRLVLCGHDHHLDPTPQIANNGKTQVLNVATPTHGGFLKRQPHRIEFAVEHKVTIHFSA